MQDSLAALAQKYRDEMLKMYHTRPESSGNAETRADIASDEMPDKKPDTEPEITSDTIPDSISDAAPGTTSDITPDITSEAAPERIPDAASGTTSDITPDITPEAAPEMISDVASDTTPDTIPKVASNIAPEIIPDTTPEIIPDTDYETPTLPAYIQPVPPSLPSQWSEQEAEEQRNSAEGKLYVFAATADSAYPVPNARVTIYSRMDDDTVKLHYLLITDESGLTPVVTLPAPSAMLSQQPEQVKPFATYQIKIYADGYFREEANDVPVFAGITSRQVFQMIPLPLALDEDAETIQLPSAAETV